MIRLPKRIRSLPTYQKTNDKERIYKRYVQSDKAKVIQAFTFLLDHYQNEQRKFSYPFFLIIRFITQIQIKKKILPK